MEPWATKQKQYVGIFVLSLQINYNRTKGSRLVILNFFFYKRRVSVKAEDKMCDFLYLPNK